MNPHEITRALEEKIADYTGAPYCICVDNESNALSLVLEYIGIEGKTVTIPSNTYPSVACEIILAGGKVKFDPDHPNLRPLNKKEKRHYDYLKKSYPDDFKALRVLTGEYQLKGTNIWDSALRFTADMYRPGQFQCLSFTGQWKILKTVKGGAILTDNKKAAKWFRRAEFSGRNQCSYFEDTFDFIGKNYYMPHVLASIGLQMIQGFYNFDGTKKTMEDISLPYPALNLKKHTAFR